jgi:hypothetical protein
MEKLTYSELNVIRQALRASKELTWTMETLQLINRHNPSALDSIEQTRERLDTVIKKIEGMIYRELEVYGPWTE